MKKVPNTAQQFRDNPVLTLLDVMYGEGGAAGAIERQEQEGTRIAASLSVLPIKNLERYGPGGEYECLGFKIGKPCSDAPDELFCEVELPAGWKVQRTDHSMWNDIVDEKGRKRASYFYKAAFYDRSAHMSNACLRYRVESINRDWSIHRDLRDIHVVVIDTALAKWDNDGRVNKESIIHSITCERDTKKYPEYWDQEDAVRKQMFSWLDEHKPGWNSPANHWDY